MEDENKIVKVQLEYDFKDACALMRYQSFFRKYLKPGYRIPPSVLIKFFSLIRYTEEEKDKQIKNSIELLKEATLSRFTKDKAYFYSETRKEKAEHFDIPDIDWENSPGTAVKLKVKNEKVKKPKYSYYSVTYSLESFIHIIIDGIESNYNPLINEANPDTRRKKLAIFILASCKEYRNTLPRKGQEHFTDYKLYAITSFIVHTMGFAMSDKKTPSNSNLYHALRNLLKSDSKNRASK